MSSEGFTVKDRRAFAEGEGLEVEGNKEAAPDVEAEAGKDDPGSPTPEEMEKDCQERMKQGRPCLFPEVTFATFVFSLSTSALLHLGELPDPQSRGIKRDLPLAKQTIDILGMLQEKTKGNLDADEEELIKNLLYELRLKYVAAVRQ